MLVIILLAGIAWKFPSHLNQEQVWKLLEKGQTWILETLFWTHCMKPAQYDR